MASRAQRRKRYLRRRAHAAQVPRYGSGDFHNVKFDPAFVGRYGLHHEMTMRGDVYLKQNADGSVDLLADEMIAWAEKYMLSAHRMEDWQKRVIKDVVRSL